MSDQVTPESVVGMLAEDDRLRALAAVVLGASTFDQVVATTGLDRRDVALALERLVAGGLVERGPGGGMRVATERVKRAAREVARRRSEAEPPGGEGSPPEEAAVLRAFVRGERLTTIPAARSKRRVVLDWLASRFEPGRVYPERDVGALLRQAHPDHAALRRHLVEEGFLERREGFYWRAGGTFEVD